MIFSEASCERALLRFGLKPVTSNFGKLCSSDELETAVAGVFRIPSRNTAGRWIARALQTSLPLGQVVSSPKLSLVLGGAAVGIKQVSPSKVFNEIEEAAPGGRIFHTLCLLHFIKRSR